MNTRYNNKESQQMSHLTGVRNMHSGEVSAVLFKTFLTELALNISYATFIHSTLFLPYVFIATVSDAQI